MTTASEPIWPRATWPWPWHGVRIVIPLAVIVGALLAAWIGYLAGTHRSPTHVASGYAYASPYQITATSHGWSYDIPLAVNWRDSTEAWHEGSRPACLPASTRQLPVKFAWVPAQAGDIHWRTVIWVACG